MQYTVETVQTEEEEPVYWLRVEVGQGGVGLNGVELRLYPGTWLSQHVRPVVAHSGGKDPVGEPGVVEFAPVVQGEYLLGVAVQPGQFIYLPLSLWDWSHIVTVDLTAAYGGVDQ